MSRFAPKPADPAMRWSHSITSGLFQQIASNSITSSALRTGLTQNLEEYRVILFEAKPPPPTSDVHGDALVRLPLHDPPGAI